MMFSDITSLLLGGCVTLSVLLLFFAANEAGKTVPGDDREFMDPLPPLLQFIWPLVRIIAYYICARLPYRFLLVEEKRIQKNGVGYLMIAEEFEALRIIGAVVFLALGFLLLNLVNLWHPWLLPLFIGLGLLYPDIWIRDIRTRQVDAVLRTLPAYLDFITMAVEAGLNFSGAIEQARKKGPGGPLVNEFGIILRDLRSGLNRAQALTRMARRLDIYEVTSFVNAVIQAEKMGSSLASVLKVQAKQRRVERFQRAEKKAMEAPVKLVGPLMLFIFPTTFIVLAFPLVMKVIHGGFF
jgi:tight adherence protein C